MPAGGPVSGVHTAVPVKPVLQTTTGAASQGNKVATQNRGQAGEDAGTGAASTG